MPEFDRPEETLCGWQNIKIQLLPIWFCTEFDSEENLGWASM